MALEPRSGGGFCRALLSTNGQPVVTNAIDFSEQPNKIQKRVNVICIVKTLKQFGLDSFNWNLKNFGL